MTGKKRGAPGTPKQKQPHKSAEFVPSSDSESERDGLVASRVGSGSSEGAGSRRGDESAAEGGSGDDGQGFPSLKEVAEEEELSSAESLFLTQLLRAQAKGLEEKVAGELLCAFQTVKEIAQRRAIKVAGLEGEVRGLSHRLDQRPARRPTSQTTCDSAEQTREETNREVNQRKETKALLIESSDHQAIAPTKVMEMVQRTFNPQKIGFKEVLMRPTSKGVAVVSSDVGGLDQLASAIQKSSASQALREGEERRHTYKIVGIDPAVGADMLVPQLLEQNELEGEHRDIQIIRDREGGTGLRTTILAVTRGVSQQLFYKKRSQVGWTRCPIYK